jgi:transcriptional regulator with XRE-family HTH domain
MAEAKLTVGEVIGRNLRAHREGLGWSQDQMARILRQHGLGWSRTMLAKVERGQRPVGIEELFLLPIALGGDLGYFLDGEPNEWVILSPGTTARPRALAASLRGDRKRSEDFRLTFFELPDPDPEWPELKASELAIAEAAAAGESERKAAKSLGASPLIVARAALVAWGKDLSDERDERVELLTPEGSGARTLQAMRGHVTRQLLDELRPVIGGHQTKKEKA